MNDERFEKMLLEVAPELSGVLFRHGLDFADGACALLLVLCLRARDLGLKRAALDDLLKRIYGIAVQVEQLERKHAVVARADEESP